mgnify:CR=1 FL=1
MPGNKHPKTAHLIRIKKGDPPLNPSGRPKVVRDWQAKCREWMTKSSGGWTILETIAEDTTHKDRMRATELIAAYAYGKPPQRLEHTGGGKPIEIIVRYEDASPA